MIARLGILPTLGISGVSMLQTLALLPPLIVVIADDGAGRLQILAASLVVAIFWDLVFGTIRKRSLGFHGVTVALIAAIIVPPELPLWQLLIALSLGMVLGEHIFGGRGFGFLSPATVSLSILIFSFPQVQLELLSQSVAIATLPGALLLLLFGLIQWRVILGTLIGLISLILGFGFGVDTLSLGVALVFGVIFLICDATQAASTNPGRWIYGLLAGLLIFIFSGTGNFVTVEGIVFASLTAGIFAPLIDRLVVIAHTKKRRRKTV